LVTIRVGAAPNCEEFAVHEGMISGSEFFRRALQGDWKEAHARMISMPDDDPEEAGAYLKYLYGEDFQKEISSSSRRAEAIDAYMEAGMIYVFADKVQDTSTKNEMVARVFRLAHIPAEKGILFVYIGELVTLIYERTPESSSMRKLLIDLWSDVHEDSISKRFSEVPGEFLRDLLIARCSPAKPNVAKRKGYQAYLEKE
jgi:hypothetical protein